MTSTDNLYSDKCNNNDADLHEVCYLNKGEEDEMEIYGYEKSTLRSTVTWICIVLSLGILRLVFHWYQHWMLFVTHRRCSLKMAATVLIIDKYQGSHKTYFVKKINRMYLEKLSLEDVAMVCNDMNRRDGFSMIANEAGTVVRMYFSDGTFVDESDLIIVKVKKFTYVWRDDKKEFCKLTGIEKGLNKSDLHNTTGYSWQQQLLRRMAYGMNEIVVKVDSYCTLIALEFLTPFYIFQLLSLILWFIELYFYYSFAIIAMSCFGILLTVFQVRQNQEKLSQTVQVRGTITVCRNVGKSKYEAVYEEVPISYLVPGDLIVIPRTGFTVPCDAVLLCGNCIVNESMLTGESVPVTKTALPCVNTPFVEKEDVNHTLFCGTQLLQARYYANEYILAVVLKTGYLTAKGGLIRSILYPVPHDFKFDQDCYKFVGILGVIAFFGTAYATYAKLISGADLFETIMDSLDIITIVVPPALPAAMSVGKYYAQSRLLRQKVTCINASVINVSGSINSVCFDKTGTLTEDGLDLYGVMTVENNHLDGLITNVPDSTSVNFKDAMASCHSLTLINGIISGDPLDVKMFESTKWILDETELTDTIKYDLLAPTIVRSMSGDREIGIIHQFQFSSNLQRMSVITRHLYSRNLTVYCKGSPEMIVSLSNPETVPANLNRMLEKQTEKGYRVIAVAYKSIPPIDIVKLKKVHRNDVECDLTFSGLIIFENKLKSQTSSIISDLRQAKMKIVMLTGDNIQTAICVAKECGIVDKSEVLVNVNVNYYNGVSEPHLTFTLEQVDVTRYVFSKSGILSLNDIELGGRIEKNHKYAMTGQTWNIVREYFPSRIAKILKRSVIFARMSSDQKQQVIQELQAMDYYVAMCGDGANDCGALKTADVGISLSEAEASVASPFTSQQADISCVCKVIKEGRTALVTAFGLFKFMVLYSLVEFYSTELLFTYASSLSDFQFLYIDGIIIVSLAFFFGQTKPYRGPLVPTAPNSSLLSVIPMVSMVIQFIFMAGIQLFAVYSIRQNSWYVPRRVLKDEYKTYDDYAVYTVSQFQYITLAMTFSVGKPYRERFYSNVPFFVCLIILTLISLYITVWPSSFVENLFELRLPPVDFRLVIVGLALVNFTVSVLLESFFVNYVLKNFLYYKSKVRRKRKGRKRIPEFYKKTSRENFSEIGVKCYGTMKS